MKKFLSLVLALAMTMSLVTISAGAKDFADAADVTYTEAVDVMTAIGVIDGDAAGNVNPTNGLTRGAAAKIICNLILGPTTASALVADTAPYKDVPADSTFAGYIAYCQKEGIISGYADGTFKPAAPLTGYAFMKMLLGALGYDSSVEGYTGANWSINVAKRALNVGLDNGLTDEFNGSKYVTREEAMLFALNTLTATMVEYDTTIKVGDVVVAGSEAKAVENTAKTETIDNDNKMQFAELYFTKLVKTAATDDFMRPATKWTWKGVGVGTYTETPDLTYTESTKLGTIYTDLGLTDQIDATYFRNGVQGNTQPVGRGFNWKVGSPDNTNASGVTGNGTLIEVYYFDVDQAIRIVAVDTYVATVASTKAATSANDAYITLSNLSPAGSYAQASGTDKYETEESFDLEEVVLYTYANGAIQDVVKAETTEGTLNTIYKDSKVDLAGTVYKASENDTLGTIEDALSVKSEYILYLDAYGYVIHFEETAFAVQDYAFVIDTDEGGTFADAKAKLVYLDGTTANVNLKDSEDADFNTWYYLVTHKTNDKGQVDLREVANQKHAEDDGDFYMTNSKAAITVADGTVYATSNTIVVVRSFDLDQNNKEVDVKFNAYTGVKNMPTISCNGNRNVEYTYLCKNGNIVSYIFVNANAADVENSNSDLTFLAGASMSTKIIDKDNNEYFTFNAVVGSEITTVKVDADLISDVASDYIWDNTSSSDGIITNAARADRQHTAKGVDKQRDDHTMGFAYNAGSKTFQDYYTVKSDCKFFSIDKDGNITTTSYNAVAKSTEQDVMYVLNSDEQLTYVFLFDVAEGVRGDVLDGDVSGDYSIYLTRDDAGLVVVNVVSDNASDASKVVTLTGAVRTNIMNDKTQTFTVTGTATLSGTPRPSASIAVNGLRANDFYSWAIWGTIAGAYFEVEGMA